MRLAYRPRYYVLRPHKAVGEVWDILVTFWQRGKRGWANSDTYNLDYHLAEILGPMLRYLAETSHGSPAGFGTEVTEGMNIMEVETDHEAWHAYLVGLADAFDDYITMQEEGTYLSSRSYTSIVERMRHLFDHYPSLWS